MPVAVEAGPSAKVAGRCQSTAAEAAADYGSGAGRHDGGALPRGCWLRGHSRLAPS